MRKILSNSTIRRLLSESGEGGLSGETYIVKYNHRKYVLRICKTSQIAKNYEKYLKDFEKYNIFPKFFYREKNKILIEHIQGRDCNLDDANKFATQIGKILGVINKSLFNKKFNYQKKFYSSLSDIRKAKIFPLKKIASIEKIYNQSMKKINVLVGLDATDIVPSNFRVNKNKVYLVDIEMVKESVISRGLAKCFLKWFKTNKQREKFLRGYSSVFSADFLSDDYLHFLYLYFLLTNMSAKIKHNMDNSKNKKGCLNFLRVT